MDSDRSSPKNRLATSVTERRDRRDIHKLLLYLTRANAGGVLRGGKQKSTGYLSFAIRQTGRLLVALASDFGNNKSSSGEVTPSDPVLCTSW